eukprot:766457-Hanusia_phi.AAC.13
MDMGAEGESEPKEREQYSERAASNHGDTECRIGYDSTKNSTVPTLLFALNLEFLICCLSWYQVGLRAVLLPQLHDQ